MMEARRVETRVGRHTLSLETGKIARQAHGAVRVQYGDTVVLATAVSAKGRPDLDFFPLTMNYREMTYAAGKIPGGFFKREGRPTHKEVLTARLMDRPCRPLFPASYAEEVQGIAQVLSADQENDPDVLSMVGISGALTLAKDIPFLGPLGAVRVGRVNNEFIINPTHAEREGSALDVVVAGTESGVLMMEGRAAEIREEDLLEGIMFAQHAIGEIVRIQKELAMACGVPPALEGAEPPEHPLRVEVESKFYDRIFEANQVRGKEARRNALNAILDEIVAAYCPPEAGGEPAASEMKALFEKFEKKATRELILTEGRRTDGRGLRDVRPIACEVGVLPRVHGSALFTRGETQALATCTLGTAIDEQRVDGLTEEYRKKFMLDYNFPPFSVGEVRFLRGPSRREMGHGALAERSLGAVLPDVATFPYTIRIVSDILESNGSSSMASVCGGTLCLMDAGVPIKDPVAGIAMGMVSAGGKVCVLSDILGGEDHCGDMDLKLAGTQRGVTGIQMDLKVKVISEETLLDAFLQAKEARVYILREMLNALAEPRPEISRYAPRLVQVKIDPEKIGTIIGPGGKMVRKIQEETEAEINIEDDGTVTIASRSAEGAEKAREMIERLTEEAKVGKVYLGRVSGIKEFGAFVEILPGRDGLVHISELSDSYVESVSAICKVGDEMLVKVISIDDQNRIRLSRKAALKEDSS